MRRILIVDDDAELVAGLSRSLDDLRLATLIARTGAEGIRIAEDARPDLVVLDLVLPDMPGTEVCRTLHAGPVAHVPILVLSSRDSELDRVVAFELGATDFVGKPVSIRETALRIVAILRRTGPRPAAEPIVGRGAVQLDLTAFRAFVDSEEKTLTPIEFQLLAALLRASGRVLRREDLVADVWGDGAVVLERTVDAHVMRLRAKLGQAGQHVETVRGVGYRFRE